MSATAKLELILEMKNKLTAGFGKAKQLVNSELKEMSSKMSEFKNTFTSNFKNLFNNFSAGSTKAFAAIKDEVPGVARALELLTNPWVMAAAAAVAFGAAVYKSVSMALDWQTGMAKINVTAQLSGKELDALSDKILRIGAKGSNELSQVPLAFNRIISAGLDVNKSLEALEPTLKAAKAGFTDIETVAAAGVGVMKSSGENINKVYDVLFATLNKGNAEFQDIAQYLPKIIPGAKQAGFALTETAGAWAYLTAQGQTAEQSTTGLMNAFKALSNPDIIYGSKSKGGFKKLGVDIFDAAGKMRPLVEIVTDLSKRMNGLTDEQRIKKFASIGLDMEAAGAFSSMTQNVEELKSTIDFTTNSAGQLNEAVKNSATSTDGWKKGMNTVSALMIRFGSLFLPLVESLGNGFAWVMEQVMAGVDAVKDFYDHSVLLQDIVKGIAFVITAPFKVLGALFSFIVDAARWIDAKLGVSSKIAQFFDHMEIMWINLKATAYGVMSIFMDLWKIIKPIGEAIASMSDPKRFMKAILEAKDALSNFNLKDSFNKGFNESIKESMAIRYRPTDKEEATGVTGKAADAVNLKGGTSEGSDSGVGEAAPHKQIIINVDALHKGDNVVNNNGENGDGMSIDELEAKMNEIWFRLLRNSNAAY
jgi:TP901 family phage tail tape measure protein